MKGARALCLGIWMERSRRFGGGGAARPGDFPPAKAFSLAQRQQKVLCPPRM
ncbi:MAG TPA: hypothetical protein IGS53_28910 [Leptolyngbyaceae cyanobacterium M33_DOE_097]|nr:hypothetical protein [Leptolyngbyaceae cyanobacterium M33_DOE_097]